MIYLVTGSPGNGKTLFVVKKLVTEIIPQAEKDGRLVFCNIDGFNHPSPILRPLPDEMVPHWQSAPRNSIFVIDECQRFFPVRHSMRPVPEFISGFETHRHEGFDFYIITQHGKLLDRHIEPMVAQHFNVRRPTGGPYSLIQRWGAFNPSPEPRLTSADAKTFRMVYKKRYFQHYKSASAHTFQSTVPWGKLSLLFSMVGGIVGMIWFVIHMFNNRPSMPTEIASDDLSPETASVCVSVVAFVGPFVVIHSGNGFERVKALDFQTRITEDVIQVCKG